MRRRSPPPLASTLSSIVLLGLVAGCAVEPGMDADGDDPVGSISQMASRPGGWVLPASSDALGSAIVTYDDSPPWDGGSNCSGTFTAGAQELREYLSDTFPQISEIQGYSCRQNTANASQTSMHGTGRAIDVMIPMDGGSADNDAGDEVANWLVEHSAEIGVQYIIWDQISWNGSRSGTRTRAYTGPNPHTDHLHVEINLAAANRETPFFTDGPTAPPPPPPVPPPPPPPAPPPPPPPPPPSTPPPSGPAASLDARLVQQGSDLTAGPTGAASGRVCAGDGFVFWFDVENTGNTRWTDYGATATGVGDRVGLGVLSTAADPVTGLDHVSILSATNVDVRPGGTDCSNAAGCRRTVFTLRGAASLLPGTHSSRWRLMDPSFGLFGPELRFDVEVADCSGTEGGVWEDDEPASPGGLPPADPSDPGARVSPPPGDGAESSGTGMLAGGCAIAGGQSSRTSGAALSALALLGVAVSARARRRRARP